jgi:hypothetical protein
MQIAQTSRRAPSLGGLMNHVGKTPASETTSMSSWAIPSAVVGVPE